MNCVMVLKSLFYRPHAWRLCSSIIGTNLSHRIHTVPAMRSINKEDYFISTPIFYVNSGKAKHTTATYRRVSVPSPIAVEKLMDTINGEGQSSHVLVFCVNFERHICTHITTSIKCYLVSLRYVYVPFTNISCQSNWHEYI